MTAAVLICINTKAAQRDTFGGHCCVGCRSGLALSLSLLSPMLKGQGGAAYADVLGTFEQARLV